MFQYLSDRAQENGANINDPARVKRVDNLPLVIAGPILRHVSPTEVNVWLALKHDVNQIDLKIFEGSALKQGYATTRTTVRVGLHLVIVLVRATFSVPNLLAHGFVYEYDINFGGYGGLASDNVLACSVNGSSANGISKITYASSSFTKPSFCLPPVTAADVRIIHASCRKAHGEGLDGYYSISKKIIEPNLAYPLPFVAAPGQPGGHESRPHLLFLTGDQVYTDDVADVLLFMIDDAAKALLGWVETIHGINDGEIINELGLAEAVNQEPKKDGNSYWPIDSIAPGKGRSRQNLVRDKGKLTSTEARNHLFRFGEFCAMYLFCWSQELWPNDQQNFDSADQAVTIVHGHSLSTDELTKFNKHYEALFNEGGLKSNIEHARRAMANVPTYMMCDDHEVTDDWFVNRKWCQDVLGDSQKLVENILSADVVAAAPVQNSETDNRWTVVPSALGERIVLNGLASFVLFQALGNTPQDWFATSGPYAQALAALRGLYAQQNSGSKDRFTSVKDAILPRLRIQTKGPYTPSANAPSGKKDHDGKDDLKRLVGPLNFGFVLRFGTYDALGNFVESADYRVVVLDTRTKRAFTPQKEDWDPILVHYEELSRLLPPSASPGQQPLIVLISPAPIFGDPRIENKQLNFTDGGLSKPVAGRPFPNFTKRDKNKNLIPDPEEDADLEAWGFNERSIFVLGNIIANATCRVVILSGDVHYAYSKIVEIWSVQHDLSTLPVIAAQLVSSSLKNHDGSTRMLSGITQGNVKMSTGIWSEMSDFNCYYDSVNMVGPKKVRPFKSRPLMKSNDAYPTYAPFINKYPNLSFRISAAKDLRSDEERGVNMVLTSEENINPMARVHERAVNGQKAASRYKWGRRSSGWNNVGDVTFDASGALNVVHRLWHHLTYKGEEGDFTGAFLEHRIELTPPSLTDDRLGG